MEMEAGPDRRHDVLGRRNSRKRAPVNFCVARSSLTDHCCFTLIHIGGTPECFSFVLQLAGGLILPEMTAQLKFEGGLCFRNSF